MYNDEGRTITNKPGLYHYSSLIMKADYNVSEIYTGKPYVKKLILKV